MTARKKYVPKKGRAEEAAETKRVQKGVVSIYSELEGLERGQQLQILGAVLVMLGFNPTKPIVEA